METYDGIDQVPNLGFLVVAGALSAGCPRSGLRYGMGSGRVIGENVTRARSSTEPLFWKSRSMPASRPSNQLLSSHVLHSQSGSFVSTGLRRMVPEIEICFRSTCRQPSFPSGWIAETIAEARTFPNTITRTRVSGEHRDPGAGCSEQMERISGGPAMCQIMPARGCCTLPGSAPARIDTATPHPGTAILR